MTAKSAIAQMAFSIKMGENHIYDFPEKYRAAVERMVRVLPTEEIKELSEKVTKAQGTLNPAQWEKEYSSKTPHWATDMKPSQFAKEFADDVKERGLGSILEIGCGNGRDSIHFAKSGFIVQAIDVSKSAVKLAQRNIKKAKVDVSIRVASAEDLPFPDYNFDAVFSLSVLHSTNLQKSLREIFRVMAGRGIAFIYIYGDTQFENGTKEIIITLDNFVALLKEIGFIISDFYSEQEKEFDEYGEKHQLLITYMEKM